jgi:hypothetical protein
VVEVKRGDRVQVIDGDHEYLGCIGTFVGLTRDGNLVVQFTSGWRATFRPHDLELAPVVVWEAAA